MHFKILGTNAIECLCSLHFSDALGFLKSFQLNSIHLASNFSSDRSDPILLLLDLGFICYLLPYIIFLVCHLSISLPRGQDDYIIELNFNSF